MTHTYGIAPSGFRLPADTRLGRVRLQVADLERSIEFYRNVLGLFEANEVNAAGNGSAVLSSAEGTALVELHERKGARTVPRRGLLGLYHFAILLPDRPSLGSLVKHLADTRVYAGMSDHLVSEAIYLQDPDGLGIEVYADRPRDTWKQDGQQLRIATAPLDVQNLLSAARGEPWKGMPAGTRIGHVHLHVGDLREAEAFYHHALGFDKIVWSYPGALFLSAGGYHHHLGTNTWAQGAPPASDYDARLLEWEIRLPDENSLRGAAQSIHDAGYTVDRNAAAFRTHDPWGTALRVTLSSAA